MALASENGQPPDVKVLLDALEESIEGLRLSYEKYFAGIDRVAPIRAKQRVERQMQTITTMAFRSTALRFRLNGLRSRLVTFKHYWTRVENEMERGVSRRDLRRIPRPAAPPPAKVAEAGAVASTQAKAADLDPNHLKEVFADLVRAKRKAGEGTDGLTYAALVRKLSREAPKLRARHKCDKVRFEVATIKGKVRLRARPA